MELHGKIEDESLIQDVLAALPLRVETTLFNYRKSLLGKVPRSLNDFDPQPILSSLDNGSQILVLDSKDLPADWKNYDFRSLLDDEDPENNAGSEGATSEDVTDTDNDNEPTQGRPSNPGVFPNFETTMDDELEQSDALPLRVLVFTTVRLMGFLTMCKRGSVDGTFKAITRFWRQLFILMVEYRGIHLPVAFGWLPDKSAISYFVFLWLVLNASYCHLSLESVG